MYLAPFWKIILLKEVINGPERSEEFDNFTCMWA